MRAFGYFECSAKTGEGVREVFEAAVRQTLIETKKMPRGLRNLFKRLSSR
jgi:GTPase SAR1 family protein